MPRRDPGAGDPCVRVGVGLIIRRGDQVLLIRRQNAHGAGSWSPPGGHLDVGETFEQCAVREAREETGVDVDTVRFVAVTNDVFEPEGRHYVTVWLEGEYLAGEPAVRSTRELSDVRWFPWDRLPEPLFLPLENLLAGRGYPAARSTLRRNLSSANPPIRRPRSIPGSES